MGGTSDTRLDKEVWMCGQAQEGGTLCLCRDVEIGDDEVHC